MVKLTGIVTSESKVVVNISVCLPILYGCRNLKLAMFVAKITTLTPAGSVDYIIHNWSN